tara:strand:- start:312 stop:740 length:429 start_codon:yes stop_codon:yes gene_type:complete
MNYSNIFLKSKNIAVIGLSKNNTKDSYRVSQYMNSSGYQIIPINPTADFIMNKKAFSSLLELPKNIVKELDIVNIFRKSEQVLPIIEECIEIKKRHNNLKTIWMQIGIQNNKANSLLNETGLNLVMNKCIMIEHKRYLNSMN